MSAKTFEAWKVTTKVKDGKPSFTRQKKMYESILTADQARTLNAQTRNSGILYVEKKVKTEKEK